MAFHRCRITFCGFFLAIIILTLTCPSFAADHSEWIIHDFGMAVNGAAPAGNLVADSAGNLYGTTSGGGAFCCGTVYELQRPVAPSEIWTHIILYSFANNGDGEGPTSGVIFDAAGNLYGTTGGGYSLSKGYTPPNVFKLSSPGTVGGAWTESVLASFDAFPNGLAIDRSGALYGTTTSGPGYNPNCPQGCGTLYKLTPPATEGGTWTFTVLWGFGENLPGIPVIDGRGNLYGSTIAYGSGAGLVYVLIPPGTEGGNWTYRVLYDFSTTTEAPLGSLKLHNNGHLYGLTGPTFNGTDAGTVFELVPPATFGGAWTKNTLHTFRGPDGAVASGTPPSAHVIFDPAGNMYGTTEQGGHGFCYSRDHCGVVFELSPPTASGAAWTETVLYDFPGLAGGREPAGAPIFDEHGVLYGATSGGGLNNNPGGIVYGVIK